MKYGSSLLPCACKKIITISGPGISGLDLASVVQKYYIISGPEMSDIGDAAGR